MAQAPGELERDDLGQPPTTTPSRSTPRSGRRHAPARRRPHRRRQAPRPDRRQRRHASGGWPCERRRRGTGPAAPCSTCSCARAAERGPAGRRAARPGARAGLLRAGRLHAVRRGLPRGRHRAHWACAGRLTPVRPPGAAAAAVRATSSATRASAPRLGQPAGVLDPRGTRLAGPRPAPSSVARAATGVAGRSSAGACSLPTTRADRDSAGAAPSGRGVDGVIDRVAVPASSPVTPEPARAPARGPVVGRRQPQRPRSRDARSATRRGDSAAVVRPRRAAPPMLRSGEAARRCGPGAPRGGRRAAPQSRASRGREVERRSCPSALRRACATSERRSSTGGRRRAAHPGGCRRQPPGDGEPTAGSVAVDERVSARAADEHAARSCSTWAASGSVPRAVPDKAVAAGCAPRPERPPAICRRLVAESSRHQHGPPSPRTDAAPPGVPDGRRRSRHG